VVSRDVAIGHVHTRVDSRGRVSDPHLHWDVQAAVDALLGGIVPPAAEELAA